MDGRINEWRGRCLDASMDGLIYGFMVELITGLLNEGMS